MQDVDIEEAIPHQNYNKFNNDIGLLRLKRIIRFTGLLTFYLQCDFYNLEISRLGETQMPGSPVAKLGDKLILSGWGIAERGKNAEIKKKIVGHLITNQRCMEYYHGIVKLNEQHFCTNETEDGDSSCRGDNGGPVMLSYRNQWQVEGINSFGVVQCTKGSVSANTKVTEYIDWITENMHV